MKPPFRVTILRWLVLSLTAWSGLRLATAIQWWAALAEFAEPPGPVYIAISGGVWLAAGIALLWGMWQAKPWIRPALLGVGAGFSVWYWCDLLLIQSLRASWPFAFGAALLLLIVVILCVYHPSTKEHFTRRERHDQ